MNIRVLVVSSLMVLATASGAHAAGRVPQQYVFVDPGSAFAYILPGEWQDGLCYLSGVSGPGFSQVRESGSPTGGNPVWAIWDDGKPGLQRTSATCYAWSDFSNISSHEPVLFWGARPGSTTVVSDWIHPGEVAWTSTVAGFGNAQDLSRLVYDTDEKTWAETLYPAPGSQALVRGETWWFGRPAPDPIVIVDRAGIDESALPSPRADEYFCLLSGLTGSTASGGAELKITDRRWHLHIEGTVSSAEAACFPLDFAGCHSLDAPGSTHVCPTLISGYVDEVDPYCASTEWDWRCVDEGLCADQVCNADPFCCSVAWDDTCRGEYQASSCR
jgi:hypothetical protein